jgi:exodeoxyribonuclease-3
MKIATFNVNSLRARIDILTDWLSGNRPDAICLQETKLTDDIFPTQLFNDMGYHAAFRGQKSYNGVAILSLKPFDEISFGLDDEPKDEPRLVSVKTGGINLVNTYIPQGQSIDSEKYQYKLQWFERLKQYFDNHFKITDPLIWTGDINVAPEPIDVHNPSTKKNHVCFHQAVRDTLKNTVDWGFTDVFRIHCTEPGQYTFWDYRRKSSLEKNYGWRIDQIYATKKLAQKCDRCYVDKGPRLADRPSDHTPLIAEFDI